MARPRLLMLDGPSLGLAPLVVEQIFAAIARINREQGVAILIIEQNISHALREDVLGWLQQAYAQNC